MTGASAERFGFKDRGIIQPGKIADITVFDPENIDDSPPVGNKPAGKPKGIMHVFINGEHVLKYGAVIKNIRPGRVLRKM